MFSVEQKTIEECLVAFFPDILLQNDPTIERSHLCYILSANEAGSLLSFTIATVDRPMRISIATLHVVMVLRPTNSALASPRSQKSRWSLAQKMSQLSTAYTVNKLENGLVTRSWDNRATLQVKSSHRCNIRLVETRRAVTTEAGHTLLWAGSTVMAWFVATRCEERCRKYCLQTSIGQECAL